MFRARTTLVFESSTSRHFHRKPPAHRSDDRTRRLAKGRRRAGVVLPRQSTSLSTVAQSGDDEGDPVQRRSFGPSAREHAAGRWPTRGHHRQSADLKRGVRGVAHLRVTPLAGGWARMPVWLRSHTPARQLVCRPPGPP
jgi:hypothetical protein